MFEDREKISEWHKRAAKIILSQILHGHTKLTLLPFVPHPGRKIIDADVLA